MLGPVRAWLYLMLTEMSKEYAERSRACFPATRQKTVRTASPFQGYKPRSGRGGDENLIAATSPCLLNNKRELTMTGSDRHYERLPLHEKMSTPSASQDFRKHTWQIEGPRSRFGEALHSPFENILRLIDHLI